MKTISLGKYKENFREIRKIAVPIAFQQLLIASLQLVDNLFIGHLSESTYVAAGVNAINNLTFIVSTLIVGFISGIGVYFTQVSAMNDKNMQHELFRIKVIWTIFLSFLILLPLTFLLRYAVTPWIESGPDTNKVVSFAADYGNAVVPSLFLDFVVVIFANTYKEMKKVKVTVFIAITAIVVNAIFNYIFMYVLKMGVRGSSYATLLARCLEIFIWVIFILKTKPDFIPKFAKMFNISIKRVFWIFPKTALWTLNGLLISSGFTIQIMLISQTSSEAGASLNSAGVLLQLIYAFTGGFAQAINILVTSYLAKPKTIEIKEYVKRNAIIALIIGLIAGLLLLAISPLMLVLYSSYSNHTNVQSIIMISSVAITLPLSLMVGVWTSVLKGSGFAKSLIIIDGLFSWLFTLPLVAILTKTNIDIDYGWIYFIATLTFVIKPFIVYWYYKRHEKNIKSIVISENKSSSMDLQSLK